MYRIAVMLFCCLVFTAPRLGAEVLFEDDFEGGVLDSTEWVRYIFARGPKAKERSGGFETRAEHVHSGERSFRLTSLDAGGKATGSILSHFFLPGVDKAYFRWYAKFAEDFNQGNQMHWCMLTATRTDDRESAFGKAGQRPNGTDFAIAHLEPSNHWGQYPHPGAMGFYTYFPEMKISKDSGLYYGNRFEPEEPFVIQRGRWYCFEVMVKLNEPGEHDGEQAYWIDGKKQLHQRGIRWRDSKVLMMNLLQLSWWIHHAKQDNTCWFDDVVISTEYIGPKQ